MSHRLPEFRDGSTQLGQHYDVWTINLADAAAASRCLAKLLSEDELARGARFLRADIGDRFRGARGVLRLLLGRYLELAPESLRFTTEQFGKPVLQKATNSPGLEFNVSHSGDVAAYCVSHHGPVGVDVEWIREVGSMASLMERVGTPEERATFANMPNDLQRRWFFRLWTRKEAVSKAVGEGLRLPFARLHVMGGADAKDPRSPRSSRMDVTSSVNDRVTCWAIHDFPPESTHAGAVAMPLSLPAPIRVRRLSISTDATVTVAEATDIFPATGACSDE